MGLTMKDLEVCYSLAREANDINHRLERLKAYATKCTSSIAGTAPATGDVSDKVGDGVAAYVDLEREGRRKIAGFLAHIGYVEEAIDALENSTHRRLLRLRYLDGLTWEEMETEMNYTDRHIRRLHAKAVASLGVNMS